MEKKENQHQITSVLDGSLMLGKHFVVLYKHECSCGETWFGGKFSKDCPASLKEKANT